MADIKYYKGLPICPFFEQLDKNFKKIFLGSKINPVYTHCFHPDNKQECEGNCQKDLCPF